MKTVRIITIVIIIVCFTIGLLVKNATVSAIMCGIAGGGIVELLFNSFKQKNNKK
ncbi:MAG: hypothetical protein IJ759_01815 [Bacteroidales bacterium]|nr:hypothetical protein [Bacteroidales bacterium]